MKPSKYGIYVFNNGEFYTTEEWGEKPAEGVLLFTEYVGIIIDAKGQINKMTWDEAMSIAKEKWKMIPDNHEWIEIASHFEEIKKVISQIGGDKIDGWFWSSSQLAESIAWNYNFGGYMGIISKLCNCNVRTITKIK